jgi:hypothetical protein
MNTISPAEQFQIDINAKLRARIAELERRLETDEPGKSKPDPKEAPKPGKSPGDDDDTPEDEFEEDLPDHPGSFRKKKPVADDDETDQDAPTPPAASIASSRIFALSVINAARKSHGQKPLARLQDESVLPADGRVPRDPQAFARCVANAARKARGEPPISDAEWTSLREGW